MRRSIHTISPLHMPASLLYPCPAGGANQQGLSQSTSCSDPQEGQARLNTLSSTMVLSRHWGQTQYTGPSSRSAARFAARSSGDLWTTLHLLGGSPLNSRWARFTGLLDLFTSNTTVVELELLTTGYQAPRRNPCASV